jgi:hypothetical protein
MQKLRELPADFGGSIRKDSSLTLIMIDGAAEVRFANRASDKDELRRYYDTHSDCKLLIAWTGNWRTDLFALSADELERYW